MSASRKLYVEAADRIGLALRHADADDPQQLVDDVIAAVSGAFKCDNHAFDPAKFAAHVEAVREFGLSRKPAKRTVAEKLAAFAAVEQREAKRVAIESAGDVR